MATYVLGDIHGCFETLQRLMAQLPIDWERDRLWTVGDLVNKGPGSTQVLRWAVELSQRMGSRFEAVLGNHDLHALACAHRIEPPRRSDTLRNLLEAPDLGDLRAWLGSRPLVTEDSDEDGRPTLLVHAGLHPEWTTADAVAYGRELGEALRSEQGRRLLLQRDLPRSLQPSVSALRQRLAVFTRIRTITADGALDSFHGPPSEAPRGSHPWFRMPGRRSTDRTVLFGHWAALGLLLEPSLIALDTGCVWGGALSAIRLEDRQVYREPALPHEVYRSEGGRRRER